MTTSVGGGRVNQKQRTRLAILQAAKQLIDAGGEVNLPLIARSAQVSEATAYRYFPDLVSLLREAVDDVWPSADEAMRPVAGIDDPVLRVAHATEFLLRGVLARQAAVRAIIAATVTQPAAAGQRPGFRFGLIDSALAPLAEATTRPGPAAMEQLRRDLAVVCSAEALFILLDLYRLEPEAAIASAVSNARTLTAAALRPRPG